MVVDDLLVAKRSVVHCPPHLCLISTDYKKYDLCLTFSLQLSWALGIDYMHNGSIHSYGVIFPEIKEYVTGNSHSRSTIASPPTINKVI